VAGDAAACVAGGLSAGVGWDVAGCYECAYFGHGEVSAPVVAWFACAAQVGGLEE
jgi:hypothetical protein